MVRVTGLYTLGNDSIKAEYVQVDYPYTLALYILRSSIGVKSSCKFHCSIEQVKLREWDEKCINAKTRRIARLIIILGT